MSDPTSAPITRHEGGLLCPACRVDLVMSDRQGVEIDYCPRCRGVWLDRGELDKIIERSAAYEAGSQVAPEPPAARPGYGQPWDAGHSDEYRGGHHGGGRHGGGHGRRRGFLGGLFDD
jgi:uncharacterized protein